jgi:hypothetical protein
MTANRNLLAILVCALAVTSALGQAVPPTTSTSPGFHVTGILPTKEHPAAAPAQQPASSAANVPFNGITYNGGEVMDDPQGTNVYYIWYGDWSRDPLAQTILTDFISDIGGSSYFNINSSYYDLNKEGERVAVPNRVNFKGSVTDNYSRGSALSDNDVGCIIQNAAVSGKLPFDLNGQYFVMTSADVTETSGFCSLYCAYHGYLQTDSSSTQNSCGIPVVNPNQLNQNLVGSFVGNPHQCPLACTAQDATPNGDFAGDSMVNVVAHELSESATDPYNDGWISPDGTENGDLCLFNFGYPTKTRLLPNGSYYNLTLGKRKYLSQQIWVNRRGGYCAMSWDGDQ